MTVPMTDLSHEDGDERNLRRACQKGGEALTDPDEWPNERFLGAILDWKHDSDAERGGNTFQTYRSALRKFHAFLKREGFHFTDLVASDLREHFNELGREGYAPNTVKQQYDKVYHVYNCLEPQEEDEPSLGTLNLQDVDDFFDPRGVNTDDITGYGNESLAQQNEGVERLHISDDDKERLIDAAETVRDKIIIELLWCTGFRRSTLANATLGGLDRDEGTLECYSPKDDDPKTRPLSSKAQDLLSVYLDLGKRDGYYGADTSDALLLGQREPLGGQGINKAVQDAAAKADILTPVGTDVNGNERYEISAHTVRHGYAIKLLEDGVGIHKVRDAMGHHDIGVTQTYVETTEDELQATLRERGPAAE
jgi:integrase/recombinase XerD